ncbi:MAG TPA: Trp biosynthesis-associated membrane protein [Euzebyales bacterium]|nr:Trp biosynthesis-associated membrane protein [Euzebyales bacterium]
MARRPDTATLGPFLGVVGSLVLLGAAAASWIDQPVARSIGDVAVAGTRATPGVEIAPLTVVTALAGLLCSVGLLATRGTVRRTVSLLLVVTGAAAVVVAASGITAVRGSDGVRTAAPWLAIVGAAAVLAAGLTGVRRPGRRLPARYDVDVAPQDAEWRMASVSDVPGQPASYPSSSGESDATDGEGEHP